MLFRQYELGCLSIFSYLVADERTKRAVVVDPQRDISQYLGEAEREGLEIERIVETHFHADFLSGHLELAAATGASICYGVGAETGFPVEHLGDGERIVLGDVVLEVRATPGHTPESISLVIYENEGAEPFGVLTGDALFVGDVGRPDLLAAGGLQPSEMASALYRSLWGKLLTLPDSTLVFPAHGAGSACGKALSEATSSTIGDERAANPALSYGDEDSFVAALTSGQPVAPRYFPFAAAANRRPHPLFEEQEPPRVLGLEEVAAQRAAGAVLLDTRSPEEFAAGHLAGAINVGLDGRFAEHAGNVIGPQSPVVLVAPPGRETEARLRLGRIGFDSVVGWLPEIDAVLEAHPGLVRRALRVGPAELAEMISPELQLLDVRNPAELEQGSLPGSVAIPLPQLADRLDELEPDLATVVYCAGGYRSSIAASLLRREGFGEVFDLLGGYDAWSALGDPLAASPL